MSDDEISYESTGEENAVSEKRTNNALIVVILIICVVLAAVILVTIFLPKEDPIVGTWIMPVDEIVANNPSSSSSIWNLVSSGGYLTNSMHLYENNTGDVASVFEYKLYVARIVYLEVHESVTWENVNESVYKITPSGNISLNAGAFEGVPSVLLDKIPGLSYLSQLNQINPEINKIPDNLKRELAYALRPPVVLGSAYDPMIVELSSDEKGVTLVYDSEIIYRKM